VIAVAALRVGAVAVAEHGLGPDVALLTGVDDGVTTHRASGVAIAIAIAVAIAVAVAVAVAITVAVAISGITIAVAIAITGLTRAGVGPARDRYDILVGWTAREQGEGGEQGKWKAT
jgi:hypothetical protein